MDIKLFSLCNQDSPEAEKGKNHILECVKSFFPESAGFNDFTSQKRMLVAISQSLLAADIVLVAVQSTMYNATKRLLCSALDLKAVTNDEVASALSERQNTKKMKPGFYNASVSFPETAEVMPTDDYLNCGFTITSGGQHIIYMPVEDEKAQYIVLSSLYDYFSQLCEPCAVANAMKIRHRLLIEKTTKALGENSQRVAVASNDAADYLVSFLNKQNSSVFVVDLDYEIPDEDSDPKKLAITIARNVREKNHTELGVYISNPFVPTDEAKGLCCYIAVANSDGTKPYKVFAEENESPKDLLRVCNDKLLLILSDCDRISNVREESAEEKLEDKKLKDILAIAASAAVLAASIAGFITALILR